MTEEETRRVALKFVEHQRLPVAGITAVRHIRFDHPTEGLRDLWVVCFATKVFAGVAEYPREVIVEVRDDTGEARVFGSAPREETP
jgi:hypothetical protein